MRHEPLIPFIRGRHDALVLVPALGLLVTARRAQTGPHGVVPHGRDRIVNQARSRARFAVPIKRFGKVLDLDLRDLVERHVAYALDDRRQERRFLPVGVVLQIQHDGVVEGGIRAAGCAVSSRGFEMLRIDLRGYPFRLSVVMSSRALLDPLVDDSAPFADREPRTVAVDAFWATGFEFADECHSIILAGRSDVT